MTDKSNTPKEFKDSWRTPIQVFRKLHDEFNFKLDAAASDANHLCDKYITETQDTLTTEWSCYVGSGDYVWINPPYSNPMPFIIKAAKENESNGIGCVMLLPCDPSVRWFSEAMRTAHEVRLVTDGRLSFISEESGRPVNGNNKGSIIIIWHPRARIGDCKITTVTRRSLLA